jgi:hypothetical protein
MRFKLRECMDILSAKWLNIDILDIVFYSRVAAVI